MRHGVVPTPRRDMTNPTCEGRPFGRPSAYSHGTLRILHLTPAGCIVPSCDWRTSLTTNETTMPQARPSTTHLVFPDRLRDPRQRCLVMGVLNVTPDSFSDGGVFASVDAALRQARRMIADGVDIIDIGGESTRPGAAVVGEEEERRRVLPVITAIRRESAVPISIDTRNAGTAHAAIAEGADILNDISALGHDPRMAGVAAEAGVPVVLMHMRGTPATMQDSPHYGDVTREVRTFLEERIAFARARGITRLIADPGIGFGKTLAHNLRLLHDLRRFDALDCPLLVGTSRKSFIGAITGAAVTDRLPGSIASALLAWQRGAGILRVHDVRATRDALAVAEAIAACGEPAGTERDITERGGSPVLSTAGEASGGEHDI